LFASFTLQQQQVEDGSLLYFSTIEDLLSNLKLVPFNSPSHISLRRQFLTYQSVPAPADMNAASASSTTTVTSPTMVGTMTNPYASSFGAQDTTEIGSSTTVALPSGNNNNNNNKGGAQPLVFNRDGGVVLQFEPRPLAAPPESNIDTTSTLLISSSTPSTASTASVNSGGATNNVQDRSPPAAATKALSAGKKPNITREQAEAAGYSEAPNNLKQLHEKKMAEKFAQKMAAQSTTATVTATPAVAASGAGSPVAATLVAPSLATAPPGTRTSFEIAKLAADDLGSGDLGVSADDDSEDSDMSRDFARFNNVPRVDSTILSSNSVVGSEDLFDSFAARYQTKGASKFGTMSPPDEDHSSHQQTLNDDDDSSSSSRDSSLPPYVYQQQKAAPRVPPAILVTNATPLGVTTAAAPATTATATATAATTTASATRAPTEAVQIGDLEKMLEQFINGPIEMHELERLRGSLLQAVRQVNARIDDMLVGGGGSGIDEPKKSRSKKSGKTTSGSAKRKSKKKTEDD
jgi:hypothetical protein